MTSGNASRAAYQRSSDDGDAKTTNASIESRSGGNDECSWRGPAGRDASSNNAADSRSYKFDDDSANMLRHYDAKASINNASSRNLSLTHVPRADSSVTETGLNALPPIDEAESQAAATAPTAHQKPTPVTWRSLPRKDQLAILTLARLSEPLTQTSLQAYMFYQLKSFNPSLPDSTISSQAGILQGAFTATQFLTAVAWGRVADAEWGGRKRVLLVGILGTAVSVIGFGFSKSFGTAVFFRCLGGALNGNVGVMRTMIAEIIKEKKFQSRAFLLLPMTFNIGVIIGPVLGGLLADPVGSYPSIFGPGSRLGGKDGVGWMTTWPYALPNLVSSIFLIISGSGIVFGLEETHYLLRDKPDYGLRIGRWLVRFLFGRRSHQLYAAIPTEERPHTPTSPSTIEMQATPPPSKKPARRQKLPFRQIWTTNVLFTFISHGVLAIHIGTFNNLWFVFLSTPRFDPAHPSPPTLSHQHPPLNFTGGLGLPPARIGLALAILGVIGISLQLLLYPRLSTKLGTLRSYRLSLLLFPLAYTVIPFLALLPSRTAAPTPASGLLVWIGITCALVIMVTARTFALPATAILVNNSCPHPSVLGTIHGFGQSVSSGGRTVGPVVGGWLFGQGLRMGMVGLAWWVLACVAAVGVVAGTFVREGSGHEIFLPGEEKDDGDGDGDGDGGGGGR